LENRRVPQRVGRTSPTGCSTPASPPWSCEEEDNPTTATGSVGIVAAARRNNEAHTTRRLIAQLEHLGQTVIIDPAT
jgi:hypothetical protein